MVKIFRIIEGHVNPNFLTSSANVDNTANIIDMLP